MTKPPVPHQHQRGVAVITALLLTTLAITIVASLFWQQQVQVRSIENQRLKLQIQWILRGALDWAALILREDAKYSSIDTLDEPWAVPLAKTRLDQYVENERTETDIADASLSGNISDAQARYNLTNLCPTGVINPDEVAVFERLLDHTKLDPALAQATADAMAVSLKVSSAPAADSTNRSEPIKFSQPDDLLAVPGFTPQMLDQLKDFVIFLPGITSVNVNTAPAAVLYATFNTLTRDDATTLVTNRASASFRNLADFSISLPGKTLTTSTSKVSVNTNYFLVVGKANLNRAKLSVLALIERKPTGTELIWIREY